MKHPSSRFIVISTVVLIAPCDRGGASPRPECRAPARGNPPIPTVKFMTASRAAGREPIHATGNIQAIQDVPIYARARRLSQAAPRRHRRTGCNKPVLAGSSTPELDQQAPGAGRAGASAGQLAQAQSALGAGRAALQHSEATMRSVNRGREQCRAVGVARAQATLPGALAGRRLARAAVRTAA